MKKVGYYSWKVGQAFEPDADNCIPITDEEYFEELQTELGDEMETYSHLFKSKEEIEADIVHYKADYIFFYIYDKEKIIKDRHAFETNFNRSFAGKEVRIIILQPVNM